jgi:hypothetical protein
MRNAITFAAIAVIALAGSDAAYASHGKSGAQLAPTFVPLDEITTPIFGDSRIEGALSVTLVIEAKDAQTAAALKTQMPSLRASSLAATIEFARLYASGFLPVNAERLGADLTAGLKRDHPGIVRVLITRVMAVPA